MQVVLLLLPSQAMVELDWTPSKVRPGHLQSLAKQGFMMASELVACRMLEDPCSPRLRKDMWCPLLHFMSGDLVHHHIGSSTHRCGNTA
jgi:hypothetical protein